MSLELERSGRRPTSDRRRQSSPVSLPLPIEVGPQDDDVEGYLVWIAEERVKMAELQFM